MRKSKVELPTSLYGWTQERLLKFCLSHPLPGTKKWPADNPIWECNIYSTVSPMEAWYDQTYLKKAITNLFYITQSALNTGKYPEFSERLQNAFEGQGIDLLREVQLRFTVAKIAPKVTALMASTFLKIIDESGIDISNGVICPMGGFSGIVKGTKQWFTARGLEPIIEAYDINPRFCEYYGYTQRDVLAQVVTTDKTVIACPPFGLKTERWNGTPDDMYYEFHDWCELIKKHIIAPQYILIGPEDTDMANRYSSGVKPNGLFAKKVGIQFYPEYCTNWDPVNKCLV